jgi:Rho GTPase-activating protein 39
MGDKNRDRSANPNASMTSSNIILEEERMLLSEGLSHGELRDEIYCQVMKQLTGNPSTYVFCGVPVHNIPKNANISESVFKGWQLLCVLLATFPPSKNFEPSLRSFINLATHQPEGRVDIIAKYCLRRLAYISNKGPRGKPPTVAEIEAASVSNFCDNSKHD